MQPPDEAAFPVVVFAASTGGITALEVILGDLPDPFPGAIAIVVHRASEPGAPAQALSYRSKRPVRAAAEGNRLAPGRIFLAPAGRHLLVNADATLSLSDSPRVRFLRPVADRLFETAAEHLGPRVVGVVLSGHDGDEASGSESIRLSGGRIIVQDETSSEVFAMPAASTSSSRSTGSPPP